MSTKAPDGDALAQEARNTFAGLSSSEAARKLREIGYNELPSEERKGGFAVFLQVLREPMLGLLLLCSLTYLLLGEPREGIALIFSMFVVVGITFYQERKSERALAALRDLSSPRALVIRDGKETRIAGKEVVPGDVVAVREGDRVPADGVLLQSRYLRVDESMLTGESSPVPKMLSGKFESTRLFSGSLVIGGSALFRVSATGANTEIGKIGKSLSADPHSRTQLQNQVSYLVKVFGGAGLALSALVAILHGYSVGNWARGFLAGIAVAMSLLPEELPVILTVFFAIGGWRISKKNVLTRQISAIENLGAISVLCVDKTGTLTRNEMTVRALWADGHYAPISDDTKDLPEEFHETIEYGVLASHIDPFDPMEKAIKRILETLLPPSEHVHRDWTLVHEYPLSDRLLAMSCVWSSPDASDYIVATKGAPEAIAQLCHLSILEQARILRHARDLAEKGLRVLGVAQASFAGKQLPSNQDVFQFHFKGLIGLEDPVRPEAKAAVTECYNAGIRVVMMTGDYPETACSIARQIGLHHPERVVTGAEMQTWTDWELQERIRSVNVFARTIPAQKLRIVNALKSDGALVGMTGDGVNDAPSLKWADVGIAMGKRGTDVAREASDIVLLDDCFSSIVSGIKLGRRIFDNIQKAIAYILAIHVPIAGMAILPILFKLPVVLMPIQIVLLELIIDPACSLIFEAEPEEAGVMNRPPRARGQRPFGLLQIARALSHGAAALAMTFGLYWFALAHAPVTTARAVAFTSLVLSNLGLIVGNLSWSRGSRHKSPNPLLPWGLGSAFVILSFVLFVPYLQRAFEFTVPSVSQLSSCLIAAVCTALIATVFPVYRPASGTLSPNGRNPD